ncbi:MAG TPA: hypothetical protein PLX06_04070 [Fimbriimonadaceae bacterium]|nr:hypothetical protein [Fimbriimonadaceae bacterium]
MAADHPLRDINDRSIENDRVLPQVRKMIRRNNREIHVVDRQIGLNRRLRTLVDNDFDTLLAPDIGNLVKEVERL